MSTVAWRQQQILELLLRHHPLTSTVISERLGAGCTSQLDEMAKSRKIIRRLHKGSRCKWEYDILEPRPANKTPPSYRQRLARGEWAK